MERKLYYHCFVAQSTLEPTKIIGGNMKKILIFLLILLLGLLFLQGKNLFTLKEVINPSSIEIMDNRLYVIQDASVYIYSLKSQKLITKFGQKGSGPGEFKTDPSFDMLLNLKPLKKSLFFFTPYKLAYFNSTGKLLGEKKLSFFTLNLEPIGKMYVFKKYKQQGTIPQYTICLMDENLTIIKTLLTINYIYKPGIIEPIEEYCDFRTYQNKIYILNGARGLTFFLYDKGGEKIKEISHNFHRVELKELHKKLITDWLKKKSWYKMIPPQHKKKTKYPEFLPVCKNFVISDNKIYVHTFKKIGSKTEFLIISLLNHKIKKILLPVHDLNILDFLPYMIHENKFYYLSENSKEEWELMVEEILETG